MSLEVVPIDPIPGLPGFVYAVKFICGTIPPAGHPNPAAPPPPPPPLLPGTYETAINILNLVDHEVKISKRAIVTLPQGQRPGPVGDEEFPILPPNSGFEVDCADVRNLLKGKQIGPFIKGFLVIRSQTVLSVVAVKSPRVF